MSAEKLTKSVEQLLSHDDGHGIDHILRVRELALTFADKEGANREVVELIAFLHDVDDYKLFGEEAATKLTNANNLLDEYGATTSTKEQVLSCIKTMGYNKCLDGIRPATLEGMIVSDADMCDAIGAEGILRTHAYALFSGHSFFDESLLPEAEISDATAYRKGGRHSAQHFFDKLLIIPSIMMTNAGKEEASKREKIMVDFLEALFRERGSEVWLEHLMAFKKD